MDTEQLTALFSQAREAKSRKLDLYQQYAQSAGEESIQTMIKDMIDQEERHMQILDSIQQGSSPEELMQSIETQSSSPELFLQQVLQTQQGGLPVYRQRESQAMLMDNRTLRIRVSPPAYRVSNPRE